MPVLKFDGEITAETVRGLFADIEAALEKSPLGITLYMSSSGGTVNDAYDLIHFVNEHSDRIRLVCNWGMSSAAFLFLFSTHTALVLGPQVHSGVHKWSANVATSALCDPQSGATWNRDSLLADNAALRAKLKYFDPTPEELDAFDRGDSFVIDRSRLYGGLLAVDPVRKIVLC